MGVNHGGFHVLVPEKFLNGPDVVAAFQELRGERMPESMASGSFGQAGLLHRAVDRLLDDGFVNVMPSLIARLRVPPAVFLWEYPLPTPFLRRVGILAVQRVGQQDAAPAVGQVAFVDRLDALEVVLQRNLKRRGQHGDSVLGALSVADKDFVAPEVDILHAQPQAFHEAQARSVHQRRHEPFVTGKVRQHDFDFLPGHDDRQAFGLAGADDSAQVADFAAKDVTIKEK